MVCIIKFNSSSIFNRISSLFNRLPNRSISRNMSSSSSKKAVLIFLHGLGDQGSSWHVQLSTMFPSHIKCICPTAPTQSVTLNMGMRMNSWFDLRSLDPNDPEDEDGIKSASKKIHELIAEQEKQGIPHDRIMLGGFSQGGALSLYSALTYPKKLAGVIALSCWLPLHKKFPATLANEENKKLPILQCHGDQDFVVPLNWGQATSIVLSSFMNKDDYLFKVYANLGHSSSSAELHDVVGFVNRHLPKQ